MAASLTVSSGVARSHSRRSKARIRWFPILLLDKWGIEVLPEVPDGFPVHMQRRMDQPIMDREDHERAGDGNESEGGADLEDARPTGIRSLVSTILDSLLD